MFEDRSLQQTEKLPTVRRIVVAGLLKLNNAVDVLQAIRLVKPELEKALMPICLKFEQGINQVEQDINALEVEYLEKEEDCLEYSTKIVELEATRVAVEEAMKLRLAIAKEDLARVEKQLEEKNEGYAAVVALKNRLEITIEEMKEEDKRLHDILNSKNADIYSLQESGRKEFQRAIRTRNYIEALKRMLKHFGHRVPKEPV